MSQTLHLSGERAIGVDEIYERINRNVDPWSRSVTYEVFDLDLVQDVTKDLCGLEFDTEAEALAAARNYITQLGLEVNQ